MTTVNLWVFVAHVMKLFLNHEHLNKINNCRHLLDAPASEVVGELVTELRRYMTALIYNHNEAARAAVIQHFGLSANKLMDTPRNAVEEAILHDAESDQVKLGWDELRGMQERARHYANLPTATNGERRMAANLMKCCEWIAAEGRAVTSGKPHTDAGGELSAEWTELPVVVAARWALSQALRQWKYYADEISRVDHRHALGSGNDLEDKLYVSAAKAAEELEAASAPRL